MTGKTKTYRKISLGRPLGLKPSRAHKSKKVYSRRAEKKNLKKLTEL